jgi:hypothetical protein
MKKTANPSIRSVPLPDFMERLKKDFGGKVFPDSQPLLDDLRKDREPARKARRKTASSLTLERLTK